MTGSKTLDKAIKKDGRFDPNWCWHDSDGYWLSLRPGWRCQLADSHTCHEMTVKDCLMAIRNVGPCDCADCKSGAFIPATEEEGCNLVSDA